jgi:hypothetical protein
MQWTCVVNLIRTQSPINMEDTAQLKAVVGIIGSYEGRSFSRYSSSIIMLVTSTTNAKIGDARLKNTFLVSL